MSDPAFPASTFNRKATLLGLVFLNLVLLTITWILTTRTNDANHETIDGLHSLAAKINGHSVYARDLISAVPPTQKIPTPETLRRNLDNIIQAEIVSQQAGSGIVSESEVETRWQEITHQFEDGESLAAALMEAGLNEQKVRQRLTQNLRTEIWLRQLSQVEPTEQECRDWYTAHTDAFELPEVVEATHFASIFPPRGNPQEILAKADLIRDTQKQLREGVPFSELITASSDDPAKKVTGGSLGWFRRERMDPVIGEAAFRLPIGETSIPLQTRFGFHLLTVSGHRNAATLSYEEASVEVKQRCSDAIQLKKIRETIAKLMQTSKVEILDPTLRNTSL